jgi:hypothetical protein
MKLESDIRTIINNTDRLTANEVGDKVIALLHEEGLLNEDEEVHLGLVNSEEENQDQDNQPPAGGF